MPPVGLRETAFLAGIDDGMSVQKLDINLRAPDQNTKYLGVVFEEQGGLIGKLPGGTPEVYGDEPAPLSGLDGCIGDSLVQFRNEFLAAVLFSHIGHPLLGFSIQRLLTAVIVPYEYAVYI